MVVGATSRGAFLAVNATSRRAGPDLRLVTSEALKPNTNLLLVTSKALKPNTYLLLVTSKALKPNAYLVDEAWEGAGGR